MKKIGFIDYYISEWHANNYPAWINEASAKMGEDFKVAYAWAELDVSPVDGMKTDEWCQKFGVERCASIAELCEKSDYICILAPSNPEKHLSYVKEAFPYGKRTYVDKTFAPTYAEADEIFSVAQKYGTPFFSSSALRFAEELNESSDAISLIVTGSGSNFDEYIIHLCEMVIKVMGTDLKYVKAERQGSSQSIIRVEFESKKVATMVFSPAAPYAIISELSNSKHIYREVKSPFFASLIEDMLRFYRDGNLPFDPIQTLAVMKLREGAILANKAPNIRIDL